MSTGTQPHVRSPLPQLERELELAVPRHERRRVPRQKLADAAQLVALILVVAVQVDINFHHGLISDLAKLYFTHDLRAHPWPYIDARIQYPVLTGAFMTAAAALSHNLHSYLVISSWGLLACGAGCVCALWSVSRRAAYCFALCPLLLVFSVLNWDLLAIMLMVLGWRAWTRERYGQAALWLTLGTFAKLYPIFLLLFCAVALARRVRDAESSRSDLIRYAATAVAATLVVNLPFAILAYHNWLYFWSFSAERNSQADLLAWLGLLRNVGLGTSNLVLSAVVLLVAVAGALAVWRRQPVFHIAALVFFVFMTMQKVYSPQYTLWLVAYALIAGWELWAVGVLSLLGLLCYGDASIHLALVAHHQAAERWYNAYMGSEEQGVRLLTILAVAAAAAWRAGRRPRALRPATAPLATR